MPADPLRANALVQAALDLADRPAFLDRECGDNSDLRQRLYALLAAHEALASALERPLATPADDATVAHTPDPAVTVTHQSAEPPPGTLIAGILATSLALGPLS